MKKLLTSIFVGILALLFASFSFSDARGGSWPGSVLLFPYWDRTEGLSTIFRITNIANSVPNAVTHDEQLILHLWFFNRNCMDQNFRIPFTPLDTEWVVITAEGETWTERHDGVYQPIYDDRFPININFPWVWDYVLEEAVDSNQGWAIGFAVSQTTDWGSFLIAWNNFVADAIVQDIGLGWSFGYEALSAEADPPIAAGIDINGDAVLDTLPNIILDTDPPSMAGAAPFPDRTIVNLDGVGADDIGIFEFLGPDAAHQVHYYPFCTPQIFYPQYTRYFRFANLPMDPLRAIRGRVNNTRFIILPWDGILEPSSQYQNCYFFNSLTYDYEEFPISNAIVMVRCWAICDVGFITQGSSAANDSVFGWLQWNPNFFSADFPGHTGICNGTVPALSQACRRIAAPVDVFRPYGELGVTFMGSFVLQHGLRYEQWRDNPDGPTTRNWSWGFYSPHQPLPALPANGRQTCLW